jgi:HAD superfamily hydrolase (TIGR01484 family)
MMQEAKSMRDISTLSPNKTRELRGVLMDIDGTLTDAQGRLESEAFEGLWLLHQAGYRVVPVTGRPAGWCDAIARQWPVDGVIGENGALAYALEGGVLKRWLHPEVDKAGVSGWQDKVRDKILSEIPAARVAADQPFRLFDLAIDFCEEPPDLGLEVARQIKALFEACGCQAKISHIHVNGWRGNYDKLSMSAWWMHAFFGENLETLKKYYVYCGDSPNDEPMFEAFPMSCAVANIAPFYEDLRHQPAYVTRGKGGIGFRELVRHILGA